MQMSDSEEGSETEWHGWMADLYRQRQVREQRRAKAAAAAAAAAAAEPAAGLDPAPTDAAEMRNRRFMLEPKAVISARPPAVSQCAPAALHSPSSSDSLRRTAFSPFEFDRSSSPAGTGTFSNPQNSRGSSLSPSPLGVRTRTLPPGSSLSHSTSMYASMRADMGEQTLRRPSMPILSSDQTASYPHARARAQAYAHAQAHVHGSIVAPQSSVIRSPVASKFAFPSTTTMSTTTTTTTTTYSPPYSPNLAFSFPAVAAAEEDPRHAHTHTASSSRSPSEPSPAVSRRGSYASGVGAGAGAGAGVGAANPSGSLSRSTSVLARSSLLRRRDAAKEAERQREKDRRKEERAREKEDKDRARAQARAKEKEREEAKEGNLKEARRLQRPKLSLATSSAQQLVPSLAPATSVGRGAHKVESGVASSSSLMRRVKSGSNLTLSESVDRGASGPSKDASMSVRQKKKRGVFVDSIVKKFDSAMDFVDGL
ncbi:hypothetical protein C0992_006796 [Termitomyces sp. T32_za158]|nr:hypothetical protein C0992_006796 [Termitomyces sp. T32_za158]